MTCAVCRFYDVCIVHNTIEDCNHRGKDDPLRKNIIVF